MSQHLQPFPIPWADTKQATAVTFGMEIEFMVPFPDDESSDYDQGNDQRYPQQVGRGDMLELLKTMDNHQISILHVAKCIQSTGHSVVAELRNDTNSRAFQAVKHFKAHVYFSDIVEGEPSLIVAWNETDNERYPHRCFVAKHEHCEDIRDDPHGGPIPGHLWTCVEINTPVMQATNFKQDMNAIRQALAGVRQHVQTWIYERCGLHIHAGLDGGISFNQARAFACFTALLEEDLFLPLTDHIRQRESGPCPPMTRYSRFARSATPVAPEDLDTFGRQCLQGVYADFANHPTKAVDGTALKLRKLLIEIFFTDSLGDLEYSLMAGPLDSDRYGPRSAVHASPHGTMELRYPGATMDHRQLSFWAALASRLMELSQMRAVTISDCLRGLFAIVTTLVPTTPEKRLQAILAFLDMQSYSSNALELMAKYNEMDEDAYNEGTDAGYERRRFKRNGIIPPDDTFTK